MSKASESQLHRELKQRALRWAIESGYQAAAVEVGLPRHRVRADVAACRSTRGWSPSIAATAIFECKASMPDYRRDSLEIQKAQEQLDRLHAKRERIENELRLFYPSIRAGDSLFPEFERLDYHVPGHRRYEALMREIGVLSGALQMHTKFDRLTRVGCANLFYVVAARGLLRVSLLPPGWGLLEWDGVAPTLECVRQPLWHDSPESESFRLLLRIAAAATRQAAGSPVAA